MSWSERACVAAVASPLLLLAYGCGPKLTPEEKIELVRSQYTAELKSLTVKQDPIGGTAGDAMAGDAGARPAGDAAAGLSRPGPTPSAEELSPAAQGAETAEKLEQGETPTEAAMTPAAEDGEAAAIAAGPAAAPAVRTDVILDILVSTTSQEYLPGITLDLLHVDAARGEKGRRMLWVDTGTLVRGGGIQVTHILENVDYQPGDGFFVEVRTPVPTEERAHYREFQAD